MDKETRKQQIVAYVQGSGQMLTFLEIGQGIGLRKTSYLTDLVWGCVDEGSLIFTKSRHKGCPTFFFCSPFDNCVDEEK